MLHIDYKLEKSYRNNANIFTLLLIAENISKFQINEIDFVEFMTLHHF